MILTVDIGNTNIKVGAWDADKLVFVSRMHTNIRRTMDEYAVQILDVFRLNTCNSHQFDGAMLSSVVPPLSHVVKGAVEQVIQSKRVYLVSPGLKTGLNIKIDNPASLGSDMVCAAVAALAKYSPPCVLVSMGTATAIFVLDRDGNFIGGSVSPGIAISLEALVNRTAQLPYISLEEPAAVIGKNTIDAMKSGLIYGAASMIDGVLSRIRAEIGEDKVRAIAFGGLAPGIIDYCREEIEIDDNLILEGLKLIYHKNVKPI